MFDPDQIPPAPGARYSDRVLLTGDERAARQAVLHILEAAPREVWTYLVGGWCLLADGGDKFPGAPAEWFAELSDKAGPEAVRVLALPVPEDPRRG